MNTNELRTNKQELISKYELIKNSFNFDTVATDGIISDLKRLDEPQPVKVPQVVADWIEVAKSVYSLSGGMTYGGPGVNKWLENKDNQRTFALAWFDGYEVEKEKRYTVAVKGNIKENMLVYGEVVERYFFTKSYTLTKVNYAHTRKQLEEAGFGWVFDCPGIEIEEVE